VSLNYHFYMKFVRGKLRWATKRRVCTITRYRAPLFPVLCRNLTRPAILAGFIFIADRDPAVVVAVEMWELAFYAGFQVRGSRLRNFRLGNATGLPARHFHSEAEDFAHFH
jgi:hypothetical protein